MNIKDMIDKGGITIFYYIFIKGLSNLSSRWAITVSKALTKLHRYRN